MNQNEIISVTADNSKKKYTIYWKGKQRLENTNNQRQYLEIKNGEAKFSNDELNRVLCYRRLACFSALITLFNLVKSEIKGGINYKSYFALCLMRLWL